MKPLDAANRLQEAHDLLASGDPLPLSLRYWLCNAFAAWPKSPGKTLDQLLGLVSRSGGKLHARSKLPDREQAILAFSKKFSGCQTEVARALGVRFRAQRQGVIVDQDIADMRLRYGHLPESEAQLGRILAGTTSAGQSFTRTTI